MSRYLTPSKVGLLLLIKIYITYPTPVASTVPLLSFLLKHVLPRTSVPEPGEHGTSGYLNPPSMDDIQRTTVTLPSTLPGRSLWDTFLKELWSIESLDSLHSFFASLTDLFLHDPSEFTHDAEHSATKAPQFCITKSSPFGSYTRRAQLEFVRLHFADSVHLWTEMTRIREPTRAAWRRRNPSSSKASTGSNLDGKLEHLSGAAYSSLQSTGPMETILSTADIEALIDYQVSRMQTYGERLHPQIRAELRAITGSGRPVPSSMHYLNFLDSWKARDHASSLDHLHRYFDYSIQTRDKSFYQYALLSLAVLQADFGSFEQALSAMHEAVASARENRDVVCLNFCLSWLNHVGRTRPEETRGHLDLGTLGTEKETLHYLKGKAKEAGMWSLLSSTLLSEAKAGILKGNNLAQVFEDVAKVASVNSSKQLNSSSSVHITFQATLHRRLGSSQLSFAYDQLFEECYSVFSSEDDRLFHLCSEAISQMIKGRSKAAFAKIKQVPRLSLRVLSLRQYYSVVYALLQLQDALNRFELRKARDLFLLLGDMPIRNIELERMALYLRIQFTLKQGQKTDAILLVDRALDATSSQETDVYHYLKLMITKVHMYYAAGLPQKCITIAIRAANLAWRMRQLGLLWDAVVAIGECLVGIREFVAAVQIIKAVMPQILESEDSDLAGRGFSVLADAHMGRAGEMSGRPLKQREQMTQALGCLDRAFDEYSRLHARQEQREAIAKRAVIMKISGDSVLANDYAAKYLTLKTPSTK